MSSPEGAHTQYLNVDLDILSRSPLDRLASAMGPRAYVLYVGRHGRRYGARLELARSHVGMSADKTIRGLVRLVETLPPAERRLWDGALSREFNIGIEAGLQPHAFELRLKPATVESIVRIGATLVVTVYAPDLSGGTAFSTAEGSAPARARGRSKKRMREAPPKGRLTTI